MILVLSVPVDVWYVKKNKRLDFFEMMLVLSVSVGVLYVKKQKIGFF
jgi:hypothetical protein